MQPCFFFLSDSRKENFDVVRAIDTASPLNVFGGDTQWENRDASDYVHVLAAKYGQPSAVDPTAGGMAIWKRDKLMNTCLDHIEVRDEAIPHCQPANHADFVYAFVNYEVDASKFLEVTSLSGTITYDALKKQLGARCGTIEAVIASLALASQIASGAISLNYAQANELYAHYLVSTQDADRVSRLYELLCYNLSHQLGDPSYSGSWPLAEPHGCTDPLPFGAATGSKCY